MNRIQQIEEGIANTLMTIDQTTVGRLDYTFHTTTGTVNIYDETLSIAINATQDEFSVNYEIEQDEPEDNLEISSTNYRMQNSVRYKITCKCHIAGDEEFPKRAAINKMNDVLSDVKYAFNNNDTIFKTCNSFNYLSSEKVFAEDKDLIQTGTLLVYYDLDYSQHWLNPDILVS